MEATNCSVHNIFCNAFFVRFVALCENRFDVEQVEDFDCDVTRAHTVLLEVHSYMIFDVYTYTLYYIYICMYVCLCVYVVRFSS